MKRISIISLAGASIMAGSAMAGVILGIQPVNEIFQTRVGTVETRTTSPTGTASQDLSALPSDNPLVEAEAGVAAGMPSTPVNGMAKVLPKNDQVRINFNIMAAGVEGHDRNGLYSVTLDGEHTLIRSNIQAAHGGVLVDDYYISTQLFLQSPKWLDWVVKWNLADGSWIDPYYYEEGRIECHSAIYDPWTDQVYASSYWNQSRTEHGLFTIDYSDFTRRPVKNTGVYDKRWRALAAGKDYLYAMDSAGDLYRLDKFTGDATLVGSTGIVPDIHTFDAMIDTRTQRMFVATCNKNNAYGEFKTGMYEIDTKTGESKIIWEDDCIEQRCGMFSLEDINENCPATPSDVSAEFAPGSTDGNIVFKVPASTFGGGTAEGSLTYVILANGRKVAEGTTEHGATVTAPVKIDKGDSYRFSVRLTNSHGTSRWGRTEKISLASETPDSPQPSMEYKDGAFNISWSPVDKGENGGKLDSSLLSYNIYRNPGKILVASGVKSTEYKDVAELPSQLTIVSYEVSAVNGSTESATGKTTPKAYGVAEAPFKDRFDNTVTTDNLAAYTIIDANSDGKTWEFDMSGSSSTTTYLRVQPTNYIKNDWLITPPVRLEKDKFYFMDFSVFNGLDPKYYGGETIDIRFGKSPDPESMTNIVVENIDGAGKTPVSYGNMIKCEEDGIYYIGLHAKSTTAGYSLNCDGVSISAPIGKDAPDVVTDVAITPDYNDVKLVNISFKAPVKNVDGAALSSIDRLEIYRDNELIQTLENVEPGSDITTQDRVDASGKEYAYSFIGHNISGRGKELVHRAFIGIRKPAAPTGITAYSHEPGKVTMTWNAPETDENGNKINPEFITYSIGYVDGFMVMQIASDIKGTSHTFDYNLPKDVKNTFINFRLTATTEGGDSEDVEAPSCFIGEPFQAPVTESFAGGAVTTAIANRTEVNAQWSIYSDSSFSDGTASQDSDGAFIGMNGNYVNDAAILSLPKVNLKGVENPVLTFHVLPIVIGQDKNAVEVLADDGSGIEKILAFDNSCWKKTGWNRVSVSLEKFAGKTVQLSVRGIVKAYTFILLDNFRIHGLSQNNMTLHHFHAPESVTANAEFPLTVEIENFGKKQVETYNIDFYKNGELLSSVAGKPIGSLERMEVAVPAKLGIMESGDHSFFAEIDFNDDEDFSDNSSADLTVTNNIPDYPTPRNLTAEFSDNAARLAWDEPDMSSMKPTPVTDDFESYVDLEKSHAGDWILLDRDGNICGSANGVNTTGITGESAGFFVFDSSNGGDFAGSFAAKSGTKQMMTMYSPGGGNDDWAISPLLSGDAQTITFYARSYHEAYPATFEALYSTSDTEPQNFVSVTTYPQMSNEWTLYSFEVPEGALYFAIRDISQSPNFMAMFDDVTYTPAQTVSLDGYNVYRNGVRINNDPVKENSFIDTSALPGKSDYHVSALYNIGESGPSEAAGIMTDIEDIAAGTLNVKVEDRNIIVSGTGGNAVEVTAANGIVIARVSGKETVRVSVSSGVYMVRCAGKTFKLMVR